MFALCAICVAALISSQAYAAHLSFRPSTIDIPLNGSIEIDVVISGLELVDLAAFDLNVNYDDSILDFDSYTLGDELGVIPIDAEDFSIGDLGVGAINLFEVSWLLDLSFQPDSFSLATLTFTGEALGTSNLSFSNVILSDVFSDPIELISAGNADVHVVPIPGAIWFLSSGLIIGLAGLRKRSRKT